MLKKIPRNPYLLFLPFLGYYAYLIVKNKWPALYGDEIRYVDFAKNLLHGFYSPSPPHINLWNGPGYPIILMPFVALNVIDLVATLMNAAFLYLTVVFLFKTIDLLTGNKRMALLFSALMAIYPNAQSMLPILYTEAFTAFMVAAFVYVLSLYHAKGNKIWQTGAGLILGYIILTKVIFGYVIMLCLGFCLLMLLFKRQRSNYLKSLKVLVIAFGVSVPYLAYTYYMTGKVLYWGNSGGMSLYWMSTPYPHEYGDWKSPMLNNNQYPALKSAEVVKVLRKNHSVEFKEILKHDVLKQDALFKAAAIRNIKQNPGKFVRNYYNNISRMLFNFPYSYAYQDGAIVTNIMVGSLILWTSVLGAVITLFNWRRMAFPLKLILLITGVYLAVSAALSAYPRQLDVMMPAILVWLGFLAAHIKFNPQFIADNLDDIDLITLAGEAAAKSPPEGENAKAFPKGEVLGRAFKSDFS